MTISFSSTGSVLYCFLGALLELLIATVFGGYSGWHAVNER